jgi:hypothetical protein
VTVIAQLAVEAGREGVDYDTLNRLYAELGLKKPALFPTKTLSNAKYSKLVTVKPGIWKPTLKGENFAKGHGRATSGSRRSRPKGSSTTKGGEGRRAVGGSGLPEVSEVAVDVLAVPVDARALVEQVRVDVEGGGGLACPSWRR